MARIRVIFTSVRQASRPSPQERPLQAHRPALSSRLTYSVPGRVDDGHRVGSKTSSVEDEGSHSDLRGGPCFSPQFCVDRH